MGLDGDVAVFLLCNGEGVPAGCRGPGAMENVVGARSPNRASSSLHTAKLRLMPSEEAGLDPAAPAASDPLASS